ncbi:hypothetical protein MNBD_GAMMA24-616 [hydrothermal vent metagenome]|uniref:Uncharacterized protein n=1 Tax=hydrothermal vent metagenome TaxID=652676 RepID=A0A3B1BNH6_9ZZZZ
MKANKLIQQTAKSVTAFAKNAKPVPLLKAPDESISCINHRCATFFKQQY